VAMVSGLELDAISSILLGVYPIARDYMAAINFPVYSLPS